VCWRLPPRQRGSYVAGWWAARSGPI
jgi:hypothetical protein